MKDANLCFKMLASRSAKVMFLFILSIAMLGSQIRNAAKLSTFLLHSDYNSVFQRINLDDRIGQEPMPRETTSNHDRVARRSPIDEDTILRDPVRDEDRIPQDAIPQEQPNHFRTVSFMDGNDWINSYLEAYSGMWWQSLNGFLSVEWGEMGHLEGATFLAFRNGRARMTKDWLDFSVTHISRIWKHFHVSKDDKGAVALAQVEKYLDEFIQAAKPLPIFESAAPDSIAVLPFVIPGTSEPHGHAVQEKALLATLVSLWESGMARIVVVLAADEASQAPQVLIKAILNAMDGHLAQRFVELQFIVLTDLTADQRKLVPKVALQRLAMAFQGNFTAEDTKQWLGQRRQDWKFVYFTEPDLVLHARPSVMKALKEMMEAGKTLSGHRLEIVYHEDNFPGYTRLDKVVPRLFTPLPPDIDIFNETLSCCDAGKLYPSNPEDPTKPVDFWCPNGKIWWGCGYLQRNQNYSDVETVKRLHARLSNYPLIRIKGRLPFPLVNEQQHVCYMEGGGRHCATLATSSAANT